MSDVELEMNPHYYDAESAFAEGKMQFEMREFDTAIKYFEKCINYLEMDGIGNCNLCDQARKYIHYASKNIAKEEKEYPVESVGKKKYATGVYEGELLCGVPFGQGRFIWNSGAIFEGEWVQGQYVYGRYIYPDGTIYEGAFVEGKKQGLGTFWFVDGSKYEGRFEKGKRMGYGTFTDVDGKAYKTLYINDKLKEKTLVNNRKM